MPFSDLPSGHWAEEAVVRLSEEGILLGYPDGTFGGGRTLTRYEMAVIIARLLERLELVSAEVQEALQGALQRTEAPDAQRESLAARVEAALADLEQATTREQAATRAEVEALQRRLAALEAAALEGGAEAAQAGAAQGEGVGETGAARLGTEPALAGLPFEDAPGGEIFVPGLGVVGPDGLPARRLYVGVAPGLASSTGFVAFGVQAGYDRLFGPAGLGTRLHYDSVLGARLSGSVQLRFSPFNAPVELYGGLGVGFVLDETQSRPLLELPLGLEIYLTPRWGLFVQLVSSVFLGEGGADSVLTAGLNLRF